MAKNWREVLRVDRIIHTSLWIGVLCLVIVGCIPEGVDIPGYNPGSSVVTPDTTEVVPALEVSVPDGSANYFAEGIAFERTAHEISVVFRVAEDWMVKVVDDEDNPVSWCRLNSSLGSAGLHEMKVSVEENTTASSRSARIVLMAFEDVSKVATITVKQEGVALFLERTCYEVAPKDTTIEVGLKANVGVEYKIVDADWVREQSADSRALTTSNLAFEVDANPSHKSREAKIIFYSSQYAVSDTLTIAQQGLTPTLTVPEGHTNYFAEGLVFSFMKGEAEVTFHSNVEWTLQIADSTAWCSVSQTSGKAGLHKVKVRVTDNDTYEHRSAVLRLMCDTIEMGAIYVVQNRENAILLGRQDYTVSCEATTIDVSVSTNVDFEYKIIDADWVRDRQSATRGLTTHNLTFEVDANPSHRPRETRIAFYSSEYAVADTLTLAQEGVVPTASIPEGYIDYFKNTLSFGPMASETEVTFQVNVDWQLSVDGSISWLSIEPFSGMAGKQTVTVRVTENNTKEDRTATIRLMCDDITLAEIAVTQEGKAIKLRKHKYTVSCEATTVGVSVSTNVDFEYKIIDADWVRKRQTATRGLTTHNLTFEVDANPSRESRESRIIFYSFEDAVADSLTIIQEGVVSPSVTTGDATNVTASGATLSGVISNASAPLTCGILYDTSPSLSSSMIKSTVSSGEFSIDITGLKSSTIYYYRAFVIDAGEHKYGDVRSFETTVGEAVDLGLSVKWASYNVGAESPEDYGDYFAWGETEAKSSYTEDNSITYGLSFSELLSRGIISSDGNLTASYDAATANWGSSWRMPTWDEIRELSNICTWSWTTQNGVNGYKITGPNGNFIFLPTTDSGGYSGDYWSGTWNEPDGEHASCLSFDENLYGFYRTYTRFYGFAVRPVKE